MVTYVALGSFDYADLFAKAVALREQPGPNSMLVWAIGSLFVLAAMTKSAQFPFHSWLPDTMERPRRFPPSCTLALSMPEGFS